jgi:hypothetical protein
MIHFYFNKENNAHFISFVGGGDGCGLLMVARQVLYLLHHTTNSKHVLCIGSNTGWRKSPVVTIFPA